jgi:hypothetical protein
MAKLTSAGRNRLPSSDFALPGRRYPVENPSHARNALARVSQHGTPAEKSEVRAKVHEKYPSIGKSSMSKSKERSHHSESEWLRARGDHENHGKGEELSHKEFNALDHGGKHDHMAGRTSKRWEGGRARIGFLALLLAFAAPLVMAAGSAPYGVFGGAGTFAQLPGNVPLVFTAAPTGTSATLAQTWTGATTSYLVVFSDWESRSVTLTNAATTATWSGSITGSPTATATIDGYTAPPGSPTFGFTSDLGLVWANGTGWYATDDSYGASVSISSGCTTVSATKGTATNGQFSTTATTCTPVIQLPPAPNGWICFAQDVTHNVVFTQTASTTFSCTVTGTTTSGDVVQFSATPY